MVPGPGEPGRLRWWDGARWTDDVRAAGLQASPSTTTPRSAPNRPSLGATGTAPDRVRGWTAAPAGGRSSALAVLVPTAALLPVSLVAWRRSWLVVRLVAPVPYWAFAVGYLAAGVLMFLRPVQRLLLSWLYGARRPTPEELDRLEPAWRRRAGGSSAHRFVLAVTDSPSSTPACGGHVVAVSTGALELLPDDELHGVLAHELGHHLGLHTVALTITHRLSLPIITLARIGFLLERLATPRPMSSRSGPPGWRSSDASSARSCSCWRWPSSPPSSSRSASATVWAAPPSSPPTSAPSTWATGDTSRWRAASTPSIADAGDGRSRAIGATSSPMLRSARIEARLRTEQA